METTIFPGNTCPKCGAKQECATSIEGAKIPEPGSLTICFNCIAVGKFDMELKLAALTKGELEEIRNDSEVWEYIVKVQTAIVKSWNKRGLKGLN